MPAAPWAPKRDCFVKREPMFILQKLWCRAVQIAFRAALPILPYRDPKIIATADIGAVLAQKKCRSVLIVTSKGSAKRGLLAPTEAVLQEQGIAVSVFDATKPNPTTENVEAALAVYLEGACEAIIAIGGGSVMDCAKAVGARVAYPRRSLGRLSGVMRVLRPIPTLICIPTTAGTGSETTLAAVITDAKTQHKYAMMSFPLIPHYAVLDAGMTVSMPPHLTATTGMDALTHAVEAYIGRSTTAKTRRLAKEATALIFGNLERAAQNGEDIKARENMLLAAYKAGVAFSMSYVGYVHAVAHSLGGKYDTPHGFANAVLLPVVLTGYGKSAHKKLYRLGVAAGVCTKGEAPSVGAAKFIAAVRDLNTRLGIGAVIGDLKKEDIAQLARHAAHEANPLYPVPRLYTARELEAFYFAVLDPSEAP